MRASGAFVRSILGADFRLLIATGLGFTAAGGAAPTATGASSTSCGNFSRSAKVVRCGTDAGADGGSGSGYPTEG